MNGAPKKTFKRSLMPITNCKIGFDVKIPQKELVNLYGCEIGDGTKIGSFVEVQKKAFIGKNVKLSSHSFVCEGVTIEDDVFIGHNVNFINDKFPRATMDGKMQTDSDWNVIPSRVKKGASIGTGSVIMCGITIGENSIIGAGSVVTKNVPDKEIWIGNPARFFKKI
ncbi:transferase hexapeptide repeat containing protein [Candidatus Omnitrophus magneticus]|uniref:Transferase hexapeptide repeat containing protein n=1 Tax=Candidatus Omnitrophus magneticus TaxID=1609969 RepID=A0A0F0CSE0_9BACT|nr:transferase hexapeptide repeat containing protein [Candidatus Omnitrophus magneticus]